MRRLRQGGFVCSRIILDSLETRMLLSSAVASASILAETSSSTLLVAAAEISTTSALLNGWTDLDIGSPSQAGSASYDSSTGVWTVKGSGSNIWDSSDQFHFVYETTTGDISIIAKVTAQQNTNGAAQTGLMFRNDTSSSSAYLALVVTPNNGVSFQWRSASDTTCGSMVVTGVAAPVWLKLTRTSHSTFTSTCAGYYSTDGTNWTLVGSPITANVAESALVGLVVSSHTNSALNTSTFSNVSAGTVVVQTQLGITSGAQSITAGATSSALTVQLQDASGNAFMASSAVTVALSSSAMTGSFVNASGTVITSVTIPAGANAATFYYKDTVVGTPTLTAASSGLTSATQQEKIVAAAASKLGFTTVGQSITKGVASSTMTVALYDTYGNLAIAGASGQTLNLSTSSTGGSFLNDSTTITSVTVAAGTSSANFTYKDSVVGTPTITVTASGLSSVTQQETVVTASATQLIFTTGSFNQTIGTTSGTITIQLCDATGAAINAGTGGITVNLSSSSPGGVFYNTSGTVITSITVAAGSNSASFKYQDSVIGTPTLTVSANGLASATQQETVNGGQLVFTTSQQSVTVAAVSGTLTVQLRDSAGNALTAGTGGVTLTLTSTSSGGVFMDTSNNPISTLTITVGNSSASFKYKDTITGTPTLTVAASGITSATQVITVANSGTQLLSFTTGTQSLTAGTISAKMTVQLQNASGVAVNAGAGGVVLTLSTSSSGGVFVNANGTIITSVTVSAGNSSASFYYKDTVAGTPTLSALNAAYVPTTQQETITALAPTQLHFGSYAQGILQNQPSVNLVVELLDAYGNLASATSNVTVTFNTTSTGGSFLDTSNSTISNIVIAAGSSSATIRYKDSVVGTPTIKVLASGLTAATQAETVYSSTATTVSVGSGSYASTPPGGANSNLVYGSQWDWINRPANSALPTNDWWTLILSSGFAGSLWSMPQRLFTDATGVTVSGFTGIQSVNNIISYAGEQTMAVGGKSVSFTRDALVSYGDWNVKFRMEQSETQYMDVTMLQGVPMAWYQFTNITPTLALGGAGSYGTILDGAGSSLGTGSSTFTTDHFRFTKNGVTFGVFAPDGTVFVPNGNGFDVIFAGSDHYLVVATLPDSTNATFATYYQNAYSLPTNTTYGYTVDTPGGKMTTTWNITTTPLKSGASGAIIQGWLPTNYRDIVSGPTLMSGISYASIYGNVLVSLGNSFTIVQPINSLGYDLPVPDTSGYNSALLKNYLANYTLGTGADSYGGMTTLAQAAQLTLIAQRIGDTADYNRLITLLRNDLNSWLSYPTSSSDPYNNNFYFTYYPVDHALIAYPTAYGSEHYTDIHFHYGYLTSAAGVLAMLDPAWAAQYGAMATLVAKSYANWDRSDTSEPYFRNYNIWSGHSYADGLGNSLGNQGNNQESASEAVQSWQGLILLGVALGNQAMIDAGIMGYTMESKAETEYWLNIAHQDLNPSTFPANRNTAINADFARQMQTFFGLQPQYILGIEGLPNWPSLDFLSKYKAAMQAEIDATMAAIGGSDPWATLGAADDGNNWLSVMLGMQGQVDPAKAASLYARMASLNSNDYNDPVTGISYFMTYSYSTYGLRNWNYHLSTVLGGVYTNATTGLNTYNVFNPNSTATTVYVYDANNNVVYSFVAAARSMTTVTESPNKAPTVATAATAGTLTGAALPLSVLGADDAGEANLIYTWSTISLPSGAPVPTFSSNGTNSSKNTTVTFGQNGSYTFRATITDSDGLSVTSDVTVAITFGFTGITLGTNGAYVINPLTGGGYVVHVTAGTVNFASNLGTVGAVNLDLAAGTKAVLNSAQTLNVVTIANGATVQMTSNGSRTLAVATLTLNTSGKVDLANNALMITSGSMSIMRAWLKSGLVYSSSVSGTTPTTALGYLSGIDYCAMYPTCLLNGQKVLPSNIVVKYTLVGDVDLNGVINTIDFIQIDFNYLIQNTDAYWADGDFNYDSVIGVLDYAAIGRALNSQNGVSNSSQVSTTNVTSSHTDQSVVSNAAAPELTALKNVVQIDTELLTNNPDEARPLVDNKSLLSNRLTTEQAGVLILRLPGYLVSQVDTTVQVLVAGHSQNLLTSRINLVQEPSLLYLWQVAEQDTPQASLHMETQATAQWKLQQVLRRDPAFMEFRSGIQDIDQEVLADIRKSRLDEVMK